MPLNTEIVRNGKALEVKWDYAVLSAMYTAAVQEAEPKREYKEGSAFGDLEDGHFVDFSLAPIYYLNWKTPLVSSGKQTLERQHTFYLYEDQDPLVLEPGDILRAYRTS